MWDESSPLFTVTASRNWLKENWLKENWLKRDWLKENWLDLMYPVTGNSSIQLKGFVFKSFLLKSILLRKRNLSLESSVMEWFSKMKENSFTLKGNGKETETERKVVEEFRKDFISKPCSVPGQISTS